MEGDNAGIVFCLEILHFPFSLRRLGIHLEALLL